MRLTGRRRTGRTLASGESDAKYEWRGAGRGDTCGTVAAQNEDRARAINATGPAPPESATFDGSGGFGILEGAADAAERGVSNCGRNMPRAPRSRTRRV